MKKFVLVFILFFSLIFGFVFKPLKICFAEENDYSYKIVAGEKSYFFKSSDFSLSLKKTQKSHFHSLKTIKKLEKLGFNSEEILIYVFPETEIILKKLCLNLDKKESEDKVEVIENSCRLKYLSGESGQTINRKIFFDEFLSEVKTGRKNIKVNAEILSYKHGKSASEVFAEKSCFSTNFSTSSEERKNNIRLALKMFDGLVLEEGEVLSFNEITGRRSEESGYKQAKIISNGTFVLGLGGGVCQVSTTMYNACLLAGLEIVEATSHSLPVSYVEPSFDAMVSFGSSDLKVRNNSGGKIIITTSSENDVCKIKIFGLKNKYKITRQSEKLSIISAEPDIVETDYKKYAGYELEIGEEKRLSYPKDGFISRGYLSFYNEKGELVERKQIRENRYNPTRGVIIRREN